MATVLKKIIWLAAALALLLFYVWSARQRPEQLLESLQLHAPSRLALVLDEARPQLASYDLLQPQQAPQLIPLRARPQLAAIRQGYLLYAERGSRQAFLLTLEGREEKRLPLDFPLQALYLQEQEALFLGAKESVRLRRDTGQRQRAPAFSHAHWDGQAWLLLNPQGVWRWGAAEPERIYGGDWAAVGASAYALASNRLAFSFRQENTWFAALLHMDDGTLQRFPLPQPPQRPHANQAGSAFYWPSSDGLWQWRENSGWRRLGEAAEHMALAWLDKRLLSLGESWRWLDAQQGQILAEVGGGAVWDVFVSGDGRRALLGQGHTLWLLDALNFRREALSLEALERPRRILMGSSFTLCH